MPDQTSYLGYRVYPRGFVGVAPSNPAAPPARSDNNQLRAHLYHPNWFKKGAAPREVNQAIESMWRHVNQKALALDDMEFREQILSLALATFGTQNFVEWIDMQEQTSSTGDMHMEFLRDTLTFIDTGRRKMNLHNWTALLSSRDLSPRGRKPAEDYSWFWVAEDGRAKNHKLIDVIQRWCSHPGGFADLAQTLHVLFGEAQS